jgi:hypothetical protein
MNLSELEEGYFSQIDLKLFKAADVQLRGKYWFCDVTLKNGTELTNFKFNYQSAAQSFLNYVYYEWYNIKDETKLTWTDGLWIALFTGLIVILYFLIFGV